MDKKIWPPPTRIDFPFQNLKEGQEVRIGEDLFEISSIAMDSTGSYQVTFTLVRERFHASY
jgi:hypothetical protein